MNRQSSLLSPAERAAFQASEVALIVSKRSNAASGEDATSAGISEAENQRTLLLYGE